MQRSCDLWAPGICTADNLGREGILLPTINPSHHAGIRQSIYLGYHSNDVCHRKRKSLCHSEALSSVRHKFLWIHLMNSLVELASAKTDDRVVSIRRTEWFEYLINGSMVSWVKGEICFHFYNTNNTTNEITTEILRAFNCVLR